MICATKSAKPCHSSFIQHFAFTNVSSKKDSYKNLQTLLLQNILVHLQKHNENYANLFWYFIAFSYCRCFEKLPQSKSTQRQWVYACVIAWVVLVLCVRVCGSTFGAWAMYFSRFSFTVVREIIRSVMCNFNIIYYGRARR